MRNHVSGPTQFIPALNGLRAIAALMVFACHASQNGLMPKVFEQARAGQLGVMLFFCLSGLLMADQGEKKVQFKDLGICMELRSRALC